MRGLLHAVRLALIVMLALPATALAQGLIVTPGRGIGPWTVEMLLIFRLGRPDVLPIHDLGVQKGWSVTYGKKHIPKPKELLKFGERWRPYRTVASWYMWRAFERAGYKVTNKIRHRKVRKRVVVKKIKLVSS
jgi:hypothetical protein